MSRGKLIVIEGADCTGKDTIIDSLNLPEDIFTISREPGGTEIGNDIRDVILNISHLNIDDFTTFLLFSANRRDHIVNKIVPEILSGKNVVLNRYYHSSVIYQGILGDGTISTKDIVKTTKMIMAGYEDMVKPDLVVSLYSSDLSIIEDRLNRKIKDRLELNDMEYFKMVNNEYWNIHNNKYIKDIERGKPNIYLMIDISAFHNNIESMTDTIKGAIVNITGGKY